MALIILIVTIALIIFLVVSKIKRLDVNRNTVAICAYLILGFTVLLFFLIPSKMDYVMKQAKIDMEVSNQMPSVPNIVLVNVDSSPQYILVKPDGQMSNIRFYLVEYKEEKFIENALIKQVDKISQDQNLVVESVVPEGVPNIKMKWYNKDYLEGELIISYDGKNGGIYNNATYKHTLRSILISLLK